MKSEWLHFAILGAASWLAPGDQRAEWVKEWESELWYVPRRRATLFCLGAFRDALWLRRNNPRPVTRPGTDLQSPLRCLAFLAILAAVTLFIALCLPAPRTMTASARLTAHDLPDGCLAMLMMSCGFLPAIRMAMGPRADRYPMPWPSRLRRGIFLCLKIALIQPIMLCGFVLMVSIGAGPVMPLVTCASWILSLRWVLTDQRRRCPVCLRLRCGDAWRGPVPPVACRREVPAQYREYYPYPLHLRPDRLRLQE